MPCITGIGSRKTPLTVQLLMAWIGAWCRLNKVWVRSGHAEGADWAFEHGAQDYCIAYLPWRTFNQHYPDLGATLINWDDVDPLARSHALMSVNQYHPSGNSLTKTQRLFMARNFFQVFGTKIPHRKTDLIVCWTPQGKGRGGTGQALRIAKEESIGVVDLGLPTFEFYIHGQKDRKIMTQLSERLGNYLGIKDPIMPPTAS